MASFANYLYDLVHPGLVNIEAFLIKNEASANADAMQRARARRRGLEIPGIAWQEAARDWLIVRDLLGGTRAMRAAGERYLPRFPRERPQDYLDRLNQSFLIDMLEDTIDDLVARPFSRSVTFQGDVPDWVEEMNRNVDGIGTPIHQFAESLLRDALKWGMSHVAVDAIGLPESTPNGRPALVGDFAGARPRFRMVPGPNLMWWGRAADINREIIEVRWYERVVDADTITELMNVWTPTEMRAHQRDYRVAEFSESFESKPNRIGQIPLVTLYTKKEGELLAHPPFMDIAWINLDHWQSYSDQRNLLHIDRVPLLFRKGFETAKAKVSANIASGRRIHSTANVNADMRYVETTGSAAQQGDNHLKSLQDSAREKGAKPLYARPNVTATGDVRADQKSSCDLQKWCELEETVLLRAYQFAQRTVPGLQPLADNFRPRIFTDFELSDRTAAEMSVIDAARTRRDLSRENWLKEVKRRNIVREDFDEEENERQLQKEIDEGGGTGDNVDQGGGNQPPGK